MNKHAKLLIFAVLIAVVLLLNNRYGWSAYLGNTENLAFLRQTVQGNQLKALAIYCGITIVGCVALALPGVTFAVFAGLLFGPWLGTLACLVATTTGAAAAFLVGRFFLKDSLKPMVMKNNWLRKVLFDNAGRSDIVVLLITRLVPLFPYNLQNFAYGITDIRFLPYTVYTFLFMIPGVALFTIGSAGFTAGSGRWRYFFAAGILLALVLALGFGVKKYYLDRPHRAGKEGPVEKANLE